MLEFCDVDVTSVVGFDVGAAEGPFELGRVEVDGGDVETELADVWLVGPAVGAHELILVKMTVAHI